MKLHIGIPCVVILMAGILSFGNRGAAEPVNLLSGRDFKTVAGWGIPVSIPKDTGQFVVEKGMLTMIRNRPGGDFKVYSVMEKLAPNTEYLLVFQLRVKGAGKARVFFLQKPPGGEWTTTGQVQELTETQGWQTARIPLRTSAGEMSYCLQLLPPSGIGSRFSLGALQLFRAVDLEQAGGDEETYPCFRLSEAPKVDGELEDDVWRVIPEVVGFVELQQMSADDGLQVLPQGVVLPRARTFITDALTLFQAGYTQEAIYFAIRCYQPNAKKLPVSDNNSPDLWQTDCAEIHIVPAEKRAKIQLLCNPTGAHWPEGWNIATTRQDACWSVEAAVPFTFLGATPKPNERWPMNISRHSTTPRAALTTWAPNVTNFHDQKNYRWFVFKDELPTAQKKATAEAALNQSFYAGQRQIAEGKEPTEEMVRTFFEIHTRNVNVALFVNGNRIPLRAQSWLTSYAGFRERTLRAIANIHERGNVVGIVARAEGKEPGIRIQVGRPETDGLWRCSTPKEWEWLKPGYDDKEWTPIRPVEGFFYWQGDAAELCFRQVIRGVEACSQKVNYRVNDWKRDDLGRHRVMVRVDEEPLKGIAPRSRAVWAHIPWRRRDQNPEKKAIVVLDAKTGQRVNNVVMLNCKQEYGDIVFQPPTAPGEYEIYYLPYVPITWAPWSWGLTDPYQTLHDEPDPNWVTDVAFRYGDEVPIRSGQNGDIRRANWQRLPRAEVIAIEAKTEFDRFDPMEVIATREEMEQLLQKTADRDYLLFLEDRRYPVRMFESLPLRWMQRGPVPEFRGDTQPGEYYCFQLGVFASRSSFSDLSVKFSDLKCKGKPSIPASDFTCFNINGVDWLGKPFTRPFSLGKGKIRPLWIGVMIPEKAQGTYEGSVTVEPKGLAPQTIKLTLNVSGDVLPNRGEDDLWRHARLRWLNSTLGIDDDWLVPPYTPLKMRGNRIECLDRAVDFGPMGLPEQVTSRGNPILSSPIHLVAQRDGAPIQWRPSDKAQTKLEKAGKIVREYKATAEGLRLVNTVTMEFDGCIQFDIALLPQEDMTLQQLGLDVSFDRKIAAYMAGGNRAGGYRPVSHEWTFEPWALSNSKVWIGDVNAGMQVKATEGRGELKEEGDTVLVSTRLDHVTLTKGQERHYEFRLLITPFKPITKERWRHRVGYAVKGSGPGQPTLVHIHHASYQNPWINYPFLTADRLQELQKQISDNGGLGVQLYYTVRELTDRAVELWALRSLGDEVLPGSSLCYQEGQHQTNVTGHPWLREHLVAGFYKAWRTGTEVGEIDAALATSFLSRWHNYYVEGLNWLRQHNCFYSLYLDGIGYDREVMKRVARVMSKDNPNYHIEHHQCTGENQSVPNANLEHLPFVTHLWYGEAYNYNMPPDYWLVDVSGIPFGVTGEQLNDTGTANFWRGMIYGISARMNGQETIWKLWDDFGIQDAEMLGYWDAKCPVKTDNKDVLATAFCKPGKTLIAIASWSRKDEQVRLTIDWKALDLDPATVKLRAPALAGMQEAREFRVEEPVPVKSAGGLLFIVE